MQKKSDLKRATCINTIKFVSANLKSDIDRLDIDKLGATPVDFAKLSNVVKSDVAKGVC